MSKKKIYTDGLKRSRQGRVIRKPYFCSPIGCYVLPLTKGKEALIDACDYDLAYSRNWAFRSGGYACGSTNKICNIHLHRMIMPAQPPLEVDHINGDRLDNRRANLRIVTPAQNCQNRKKAKKNATSKYLGVSWNSLERKWRASIGPKRFAGWYKTELEAAKAYNRVALDIYGPCAKVNSIP